MNKKHVIRTIETHLRHYKTYKVGIMNCKKQLNYLLPSMTARYMDDSSGKSGFVISSTEKSAIDRIESKRALDLHEEIERFTIIVECIDNSIMELKESEKRFVELRYFDCMSITETAEQLGYSEKSVYYIRKHVLDKLLIGLSNICSL